MCIFRKFGSQSLTFALIEQPLVTFQETPELFLGALERVKMLLIRLTILLREKLCPFPSITRRLEDSRAETTE